MNVPATDPVLQAVVEAAVDATDAKHGWLLELAGDVLRVAAAAGDQPGSFLGRTLPADRGAAGFVVSSGQPLALSGRSADPQMQEGMEDLLGRRVSSLVCVPCGTESRLLGGLLLMDRPDGGSFTFEDVEIATLLATIAGAALVRTSAREVPSPSELNAELMRLADSDPARYGAVAPLIASLLADA